MTVEEFNKRYPVGTPVVVRKDDGSLMETKVKSRAKMLGDNAVAWFCGIRGCYLLSRVILMKESE